VTFPKRDDFTIRKEFFFSGNCLPVLLSVVEVVCGIWVMLYLHSGSWMRHYGSCALDFVPDSLSGSSQITFTPTVLIQMTLKSVSQRKKKVIAFLSPPQTPEELHKDQISLRYRKKSLFIFHLFTLQQLFNMSCCFWVDSTPSVKHSLLGCQNDNSVLYYEGRSLSWLFLK